MNKTDKLTKESFSPDNFQFVDLGLPSGRLWATENAPGHYTFDEACEVFGDCLPKGAAMVELFEECQVEWNEEKKGLDVTGPNGNSLFFPAAGYRWRGGDLENEGVEGDYWTRMPFVPKSKSYASNSQAFARYLYFHSGGLYPLSSSLRSLGFSVRPSRELR